MIALRIVQDTASEAVARALNNLGGVERVNRVMAEAVATRLEAHFGARARERNKRGWPSRRTWLAIRDGVSTDGARVTIAHPAIRQKYYGSETLGPIRPKEGRMLALPATAEAYRAGWPSHGNTPPLKRMMAYNAGIGRWMWALVAEDAGTRRVKDRRKGHEGETRLVNDPRKPAGLWYWLARKANVPRDPNTLPPEAELMGEAEAAVRRLAGRTKP